MSQNIFAYDTSKQQQLPQQQSFKISVPSHNSKHEYQFGKQSLLQQVASSSESERSSVKSVTTHNSSGRHSNHHQIPKATKSRNNNGCCYPEY